MPVCLDAKQGHAVYIGANTTLCWTLMEFESVLLWQEVVQHFDCYNMYCAPLQTMTHNPYLMKIHPSHPHTYPVPTL